ncbi:MAG: hypothetical protein ACI93T_004845, partial [Porticoccaceae bacterium]
SLRWAERFCCRVADQVPTEFMKEIGWSDCRQRHGLGLLALAAVE